MTEAEYLASEDPGAMLEWRRFGRPGGIPAWIEPVSDRKLRLFACACTRLCWDRLTDSRSRKAVEAAERYADGLATEEERDCAWHHMSVADGMNAVAFDLCNRHGIAWQAVPGRILCELDGRPAERRVASAAQATLLRDVCGNPFRLVVRVDQWRRGPLPSVTPQGFLDLARVAYDEGREVPCGRCGGTGRRVGSPPPGAEWPDPRCPDCKGTGRTSDGLLCDARLAVLSDALEEAGCREEALLRHLRGLELAHEDLDHFDRLVWRPRRSPHARGCWALDLLLGKE